MSKQLSITRADIEDHRKRLFLSAQRTQIAIAELAGGRDPMAFLFRLKFQQIGCDPCTE